MPADTGPAGCTGSLDGKRAADGPSIHSPAQGPEAVGHREHEVAGRPQAELAGVDAHDPERSIAYPSSRGDTRGSELKDGDRSSDLVGRRRECQVLDSLLEGIRAGQSRVLVLRGESGVGKSALLDYVSGRAIGCRVARAAGVESEMPLAYAGLHQLCGPVLHLRERLPAPQRDALASAFRLSAGPAPDRFVVGLAVLGLLSEIAGERPLVCVFDDAQWLDNASALALAFVARRLPAAPIGLVFALPEPRALHEFSGLPELAVDGLNARDAQGLLESAMPGRLDERVRNRIASESHGNPLTLLDLAHSVAPAKFAGGYALPDAMPAEQRSEEAFVQQLELLPIETRRLLLIAATEPLGDTGLLWRASGQLGLGPEAASPAQAAGMIDIGALVRFSHPLLRSAVYRHASLSDRREAHRALAEVTDPVADPGDRAWHQAYAADGPDEEVAAELERTASWAAARGGVAAAAAFLGRATELTPDAIHRGQRALQAATAKVQAGGFEDAISMLTAEDTEPVDELRCARVDLTRGRIAIAQGRPGDASRLLLAAARTLEQRDVGLARETYLDALKAAMFAGHLPKGPSVLQVAQAAHAAPTVPIEQAGDMLLNALAVRLMNGDAAAVELSKQAVQACCADDYSVQDGLPLLWLTSATSAKLWDDQRWGAFSAHHVKIAREAGALSELTLALTSRVYFHLFAGDLAEASSLVQEVRAVTQANRANHVPYGAIGLAAWQGREDEVQRLLDATMSQAADRGEDLGNTAAYGVRALLLNGRCQYKDALAAAAEAANCEQALSAPNWGSIELIEAAARSGATDLATDALQRLSETTRASNTDWALGLEARSRALLSPATIAESLYREAIERLDRTHIRVDLARARLLYGEWLRREGRRLDAREQLRTAHNMFATMGMEAFTERTRRELIATGEKVCKRTVGEHGQLTPQEKQIGLLARHGLSNSEIAAELFISGRTVEWHLRNVFSKLGIASRKQLQIALPEGDLPLAAA